MAYGRLGIASLTSGVNTTVYTIPANCLYAEININVLNTAASDANIEIALATSGSPNADEYIDKGGVAPANGGILEHTDLKGSPGERVIVKSNQAGTVVRVHGREITKV